MKHPNKSHKPIITLVFLVIAAIGTYLLVASHALSDYVTAAADKGNVISPAQKVADTRASDGNYVQFGNSSGGSVNYGWQLTDNNTGLSGVGVNKNNLPVFNGTITAGQTLSNVQIDHPIDLSSTPNVTLSEVWIHPSTGGDAVTLGNGTVIKDSDIDGDGSASDETIVGLRGDDPTGYSIQRVHETTVSIGAWIDGTGIGSVTDSYLKANFDPECHHTDGVTRRSGTGSITYLRDRVLAQTGCTTGAFFLQTLGNSDTIAGVGLQNTMLEGSGYVITLDPRQAPISLSLNNVRVNLTTPGNYNDLTVGPGTDTLNVNQWTNVFDYNPNAPSDSIGGAEGAAIGSP